MASLQVWIALCGLAVAIATKVAATSCSLGHVQPKIRRGDVPARSVNIGRWLVSEYWMCYDSTLYTSLPLNESSKSGEYGIMKKLGLQAGTAAFKQHRDLWINETHIEAIAAAVHAPSDSQINTYARGSLAYLDKLVNEWSVKHNVAVMLSLHAHQDSQNGYEHSALATIGSIDWYMDETNRDNSVNFATFLSRRYRSSTAFLGVNAINEPKIDDYRNHTVRWDYLKTYYERVYSAIRSDGNNCVISLMPMLEEQDAGHLSGLLDNGTYTNIWHELHSYFIWGYEGLSETDILRHVDAYRDNVLLPASKNPHSRLFIGEWSMGAPPDGLCIFTDTNNFHEFGHKQLEVYTKYGTGGWAFWTWRTSDDTVGKRSGWSMRALLEDGDLVLTH